MARLQQNSSGKPLPKRKKAIAIGEDGAKCTDREMLKTLREHANENNLTRCSKGFQKNFFTKKNP